MNEHFLPNGGRTDNPPLTGKLMPGKDIAKRAKKSPPAVRAVLAAAIARGDVAIAPTTAQTALLFNLSTASVRLAMSASDEDLALLRRGALSLRSLRAKHRKPPVVAKTVGEIEALVGGFGLGAVKQVFGHLFDPSRRVEAEIENFLCLCNPAEVASVLDRVAPPPALVAAE
jgi:hypothetical protein